MDTKSLTAVFSISISGHVRNWQKVDGLSSGPYDYLHFFFADFRLSCQNINLKITGFYYRVKKDSSDSDYMSVQTFCLRIRNFS